MLCKEFRRRPSTDHRLVWATGKNITVIGVEDRGWRYLSDFYTTLIDIKWRWNLLFFVVCFVLTWLGFACFYFLLCVLHGDLDPVHMNSTNWKPCVFNVKSFTAAYLFSIETMTTIGYGSRYQTEECPGVYLAVMLESVIGAGLQFALASLVVSKIRRAKRRSETILFSDTAVTFQEDGKLKLAVRIGDMRKGDVIGAHATGMLIKKTTGKEGQKVPVRMYSVSFDAEGGRGKLFLYWPALLVHVVDEDSPLWPLSRDDLLNQMYELIVVLDGIAASTSKPFQARKSYHSWEILWGHRFKPLDMGENDSGVPGYVVNYENFHSTYPVAIPLCSAMELEYKQIEEELSKLEEEELSKLEERSAKDVDISEQKDHGSSPTQGPGTNRGSFAQFSRQESTCSRQESILSSDTFDDVESSWEESDDDGDDEGGELSTEDTDVSVKPNVGKELALPRKTGGEKKRTKRSMTVRRVDENALAKQDSAQGEKIVLSGIHKDTFQHDEHVEECKHDNITDDQKEVMKALAVVDEDNTGGRDTKDAIELSPTRKVDAFDKDVIEEKTTETKFKVSPRRKVSAPASYTYVSGKCKGIKRETIEVEVHAPQTPQAQSSSEDQSTVVSESPDLEKFSLGTSVESAVSERETRQTDDSESVQDSGVSSPDRVKETTRVNTGRFLVTIQPESPDTQNITDSGTELQEIKQTTEGDQLKRGCKKDTDAQTQTDKTSKRLQNNRDRVRKISTVFFAGLGDSNETSSPEATSPTTDSQSRSGERIKITIEEEGETTAETEEEKPSYLRVSGVNSQESRDSEDARNSSASSAPPELKIRRTSMAPKDAKDRVRKTSRVEFEAGTKDNEKPSRRTSTASNPGSRSSSRERVRKSSRVEFPDSSDNNEESSWRVSRVPSRGAGDGRRPSPTPRMDTRDGKHRIRKTSRVEFADSSDNNEERVRRTPRASPSGSRASSTERTRRSSRLEVPYSSDTAEERVRKSSLSSSNKERTRKTSRVEFADSSDNNEDRPPRPSGLTRQSSSGSNSSPVRRPSRVSQGSREGTDRVRKTSRFEFQEIPTSPRSRIISLQQPASPSSQQTRIISFGDALNRYRHRRSVTDTYLGTDGYESEDTEENAAVMSILSQRTWNAGTTAQEKRVDVRDTFKLRRKSVTLELLFGPEDEAESDKGKSAESREGRRRRHSTPHKK